jgi:hypothetical protein
MTKESKSTLIIPPIDTSNQKHPAERNIKYSLELNCYRAPKFCCKTIKTEEKNEPKNLLRTENLDLTENSSTM